MGVGREMEGVNVVELCVCVGGGGGGVRGKNIGEGERNIRCILRERDYNVGDNYGVENV